MTDDEIIEKYLHLFEKLQHSIQYGISEDLFKFNIYIYFTRDVHITDDVVNELKDEKLIIKRRGYSLHFGERFYKVLYPILKL